MKNNIFLSVLLCVLSGSAVLVSCKKSNSGGNPSVVELDPDSAAGGAVLTLTGSGLNGMRTIVFDNGNVPAAFNPVFNTDNALVFRVPDTANGGSQNILFTNAAGNTVKVPFKVIALPTVSQVSVSDFTANTQVTLTGNNLGDVNKVVLTSSPATAVTIVSKSKKQLVLTMPAAPASVYRTRLDITNISGVITTGQEFTSVDNNFGFFKDDYDPTVQNWGWNSGNSVATDQKVTGTASLKSVYGKGSWGAVSLHRADPKIAASDYTYLTFWVKGGTQDNQIDVNSENGGSLNTITVPANVWSYYKMPISGFLNGVNIERLDFKMHGPDNADQTVYFDNILMVK